MQEFPITILTTMDPDDEVVHLHTCISHKFYCIFTEDAYSTIVDEPSSNEDGEDEEICDNCTHRTQGSTDMSHALIHNLSTAVTPPISPVIHTNPLQQGRSLATMSMLPSSIWTQDFSPSSGCYNSLFDVSKPIVEHVYELATSSSGIHELDIRGTTAYAMAVKLQVLLENAANKGDFTEVLSPQRTFIMYILYSYHYNLSLMEPITTVPMSLVLSAQLA